MVFKKTFPNVLKSFISSLFFHRVEKFTHCIICDKKLKGRQRRYCSEKCKTKYWTKANSPIVYTTERRTNK